MSKNLRFTLWAVFSALTGCLVVYVYVLKWIIFIGETVCENLIQYTEQLKTAPVSETISNEIVIPKKQKKKVA